MEITVEVTGDGYRFSIPGCELVVELRDCKEGKAASLHNNVARWSPGALKEYIEAFEQVKVMLKNVGVKFLVATCHGEPKIKKYWRLMGFRFFGKEDDVEYAVMEV